MPLSRRHFLQSTAASLALNEAARTAQHPAKPISPNDRVQIGCIGFGIMGQGDMKTESSLPGVEIIAVPMFRGRKIRDEDSGATAIPLCGSTAPKNYVTETLSGVPELWEANFRADGRTY